MSSRPEVRVLVATDQWFPEVRGGVARVAAQTARGLATRGHEVTVLAPRSRNETRESRAGSLTVLRVLNRHGLPQTLADPVETCRRAWRLRDERFDVAVAHQSTTAAGLAWSGIDAPIALVFHASGVRETRFLRSRAAAFGWDSLRLRTVEVPLAALERTSLTRATGVLVLSDFSRSIVLEDRPDVADRVLRVSGGVDTASFFPGDGMDGARLRLGLSPDARVLLTVRRLEPRMGLGTLLHALALLKARVELVIAGTGPLEKSLQRLASELGLGTQVRFMGGVTDPELADWYRAADLFVLPTTAYEGFGMATLEALASGTPVVGTPVGATPELLRPLDPRLVATGSDALALAETIRSALPLARGELRGQARRYVEEAFSWDVVTPLWEKAFRRVASRDLASSTAATRRSHDD